jgi:hypothetical protein
LLSYFVATNITRVKIVLLLNWKRKQFELIYKDHCTLYPQIATKLSKIWFWDLGKTYSGSATLVRFSELFSFLPSCKYFSLFMYFHSSLQSRSLTSMPPESGLIILCLGMPEFFCQQDFNIPSLVICLSILTVFRIYDILGWIRIRGSMPLTNGYGSCYFVIDLQEVNKKLFF